MLARSLDDSFRGLSFPSYKIKLAECRSTCSSQPNKVKLQTSERFLATSANQTRTLDEIPYEHWTRVRKSENEYLKNLQSLKPGIASTAMEAYIG
jgi:hypothetical protein